MTKKIALLGLIKGTNCLNFKIWIGIHWDQIITDPDGSEYETLLKTIKFWWNFMYGRQTFMICWRVSMGEEAWARPWPHSRARNVRVKCSPQPEQVRYCKTDAMAIQFAFKGVARFWIRIGLETDPDPYPVQHFRSKGWYWYGSWSKLPVNPK